MMCRWRQPTGHCSGGTGPCRLCAWHTKSCVGGWRCRLHKACMLRAKTLGTMVSNFWQLSLACTTCPYSCVRPSPCQDRSNLHMPRATCNTCCRRLSKSRRRLPAQQALHVHIPPQLAARGWTEEAPSRLQSLQEAVQVGHVEPLTPVPRHHSSYRLVTVEALDVQGSLEPLADARPALQTFCAPVAKVGTWLTSIGTL